MPCLVSELPCAKLAPVLRGCLRTVQCRQALQASTGLVRRRSLWRANSVVRTVGSAAALLPLATPIALSRWDLIAGACRSPVVADRISVAKPGKPLPELCEMCEMCSVAFSPVSRWTLGAFLKPACAGDLARHVALHSMSLCIASFLSAWRLPLHAGHASARVLLFDSCRSLMCSRFGLRLRQRAASTGFLHVTSHERQRLPQSTF